MKHENGSHLPWLVLVEDLCFLSFRFYMHLIFLWLRNDIRSLFHFMGKFSIAEQILRSGTLEHCGSQSTLFHAVTKKEEFYVYQTNGTIEETGA